MNNPAGFVPASDYCSHKKIAFEQAVRAIKNGSLKGKSLDGEWLVEESEWDKPVPISQPGRPAVAALLQVFGVLFGIVGPIMGAVLWPDYLPSPSDYVVPLATIISGVLGALLLFAAAAALDLLYDIKMAVLQHPATR